MQAPVGERKYSPHADYRRTERGIKERYIDLCMQLGSRGNTYNSAFRFFFCGLVVVTTQSSDVVTAYWKGHSMATRFDEILAAREQRRNVKKPRKKARETKKHKRASDYLDFTDYTQYHDYTLLQ